MLNARDVYDLIEISTIPYNVDGSRVLPSRTCNDLPLLRTSAVLLFLVTIACY